jgi:hypothetical protein
MNHLLIKKEVNLFFISFSFMKNIYIFNFINFFIQNINNLGINFTQFETLEGFEMILFCLCCIYLQNLFILGNWVSLFYVLGQTYPCGLK